MGKADSNQIPKHGKKKRPNEAWKTFKRVFKTPSAKLGGVLMAIIIFCAVFAPLIAPYDPYTMDLTDLFATPTLKHLFGTDAMGRDVFSRVLYGAKYSLALGLFTAFIGTMLGVVLGSLAGYFGGIVETIIMRFCDIWGAIPGMLLNIVISACLGTGFFNTILAMSIGTFPGGARMTRGQILAERSKEYLEAAESINASKTSIMFKHLLPNVISPTIVSTTMAIGGNITAAAGLSYLGLGIQPPTPEWGALLSDGTTYINSYPHLLLYPGLVIGVTVLAINLMGDGVRDAMDPKLRD
ncbi:MAG: ABC transporter permease [Lachnospiraceae bacterium]|nr:ABC transporter permease [Lachnospiraceae bacterium]